MKILVLNGSPHVNGATSDMVNAFTQGAKAAGHEVKNINVAHKSILDRYRELFNSHPDYVLMGFHMMKREGEYTAEEKAVIIQTAQELSRLDTVFYSGHCTGAPAFALMKEIMGDKLIALHSGETVV